MLKVTDINWANIEKSKIQDDILLFYSIAVSSFLESKASLFAKNLIDFFGEEDEISTWIDQVWKPEELNHGSIMKMYIETVWSDYDWNNAYEQFNQSFSLRSLPIERLKLNYTSGLISLCTTEIDAALYYRTLSEYSNEPVLKQILKLMFADEVKHYRVFLKYFYLQDQKEKSSSWKIFKTIVNRHELVAQQNIAVSLKHARDGWHSDSYFKNNFNDQEILHKMKLKIAKRFPYELAAKMLAKPLKNNFLYYNLILVLIRFNLKYHMKA